MLTDRFIKSVKAGEKEKFIADFDGLYLRIAAAHKGGSKTWKFHYKPPGSKYPIKKGLGKYPDLELAEARDLVRDHNKSLSIGTDPFKKKKEIEFASDFVAAYAKLKKLDEGSQAYKKIDRDVNRFVESQGDRAPHEYAKIDINDYISDRLLEVKTGAVRRELNSIQAVFNLVYEEHEIDHFHRFRKLKIPKEKEDQVDREDFSSDQLSLLRDIVGGSDNKVEQIIGLLIDTGMRSAEAVGLASEDVKLGSIPHIVIHRNTFRRLKNKASKRIIPLVGSSLAVAHSLDLTYEWIFPKYLKSERGTDSANKAVNNRLRVILGPGSPTSHSFRHTLSTRLRSVECPEYMRKELGGWASSVSELYGSPTDITNKAGYIEKSLDWVTEIL